MKITIEKKITTVGGSLGFLIDKPLRDKLKIKKGDWIKAIIEKKK